MNQKHQDHATPNRQEVSRVSLQVRVLVGGALSAVILTASGLLLSSNNLATTLSWPHLAANLLSGLLYVAVMTPLARRIFYRRLPRFLAVFLPLYLTGTLADLVEAYFYTTLLTPASLVAALIVEAIPVLLIAGIIVWLIPAAREARGEPGFAQVMRERSFLSWLWRIVGAGAPYALIYLAFAALVAPIEHSYYHDQAFIASLHTRVPSTEVTLLLEAGRGILFVLAQLPIIAALRKSRWSTGVSIALIGAALEAWVPLLGQTSWPVLMRVGNVVELTGDACVRALLMAFLVALPALPGRLAVRQQLSGEKHPLSV